MHRIIRRAVTTAVATVGATALFTGTVLAHYCYFQANPKSQGTNGKAWSTPEEYIGFVEQATAMWEGDCATAAANFIAVLEDLPEGTRMLGPGLLAGGTAGTGKTPSKIGYLPFDQIPDECFGPEPE
jgi:hypothetical protein